MWVLLGIVGSKIKRFVATLLAAGALILGVFVYGRVTQKNLEKIKDLEEYKETRERIDEAHVNTDVADSIERLRRNNQIR